MNPPVTGWLRAGGTMPEASYSLLSISNPEVLLWSLKPAEDGPGKGIVTRVWNLSTKPQDYSLALSSGVSSAMRTTHIETDLAPLAIEGGKVTVHLEASQMQTMRLTPAKVTAR